MSALDWVVLLGAATTIAWVNWYFFLAERAHVVAAASGGTGTSAGAPGGEQSATPEVTIVVQGGYDPRTVRVQAGRAVRLVFDRQETSGCSEEVVFGDFGIRKFLPAHQKTVVEITPPEPGTYEFTCGMSMLRGKIIAE